MNDNSNLNSKPFELLLSIPYVNDLHKHTLHTLPDDNSNAEIIIQFQFSKLHIQSTHCTHATKFP